MENSKECNDGHNYYKLNKCELQHNYESLPVLFCLEFHHVYGISSDIQIMSLFAIYMPVPYLCVKLDVCTITACHIR